MSDATPSRLMWDRGEIVLTSWPGSPEIDSVEAMVAAMAMLLRRARHNQGLLLSETAFRSGMSMSVLSRVERAQREPRLRLVLALCNVLGVRFSDVMRAAEDEAFPLGGIPWAIDPAPLLVVRQEVSPQIGPEEGDA